MAQVLKRLPPQPRGLVPRMRISLAQRVAALRERLARERRFSFRDLIAESKSRSEVVVSFLAVLELIKAGACEAKQAETWGEIEVVAREITATAAV